MSRYTALHSGFTLLVVIVGIAGVVHDSLARTAPVSYMNLHALFGGLLWISVVARFHRRLRQSPRMLPIDIREFSRHLSRLVYLMLYILMFTSLITGAVTSVAAPDFQAYLGYGLFALITIHVLAAICRRRTRAMVPAAR
jgi:cytochrome b561